MLALVRVVIPAKALKRCRHPASVDGRQLYVIEVSWLQINVVGCHFREQSGFIYGHAKANLVGQEPVFHIRCA